jgi:fumarate hydratase class I
MKELEYPFTEDVARALRVGDRVSLSGRIVTGRDRVHEKLASEESAPVDMRNGAIYHCGPVVVRESGKWVIRSAGPTTSSRQESFMPEVIRRHGVRLIIGKGGMGEKTRHALREFGCAYIHVVGGAGAVLAEKIDEVRGVHYLDDFGAAEAMWELDVKSLEGTVTMDSVGGSLHQSVTEESRKTLASLFQAG